MFAIRFMTPGITLDVLQHCSCVLLWFHAAMLAARVASLSISLCNIFCSSVTDAKAAGCHISAPIPLSPLAGSTPDATSCSTRAWCYESLYVHWTIRDAEGKRV